jgi:hypothetical protein
MNTCVTSHWPVRRKKLSRRIRRLEDLIAKQGPQLVLPRSQWLMVVSRILLHDELMLTLAIGEIIGEHSTQRIFLLISGGSGLCAICRPEKVLAARRRRGQRIGDGGTGPRVGEVGLGWFVEEVGVWMGRLGGCWELLFGSEPEVVGWSGRAFLEEEGLVLGGRERNLDSSRSFWFCG